MNFVIVIAHQKGGVGKSTIASNLAVELSKKHTLSIVDLDMQKSLSYFNTLRKDANKIEILHVKTFDEFQKIVNNNNRILLIDVGGFDSDLNRAAILSADIILTPVSDSAIELVGLLSFKNILTEIRKHRSDLQAHILLNRIHTSASSSLNQIREFINNNNEFQLLESIIRDRVEYKKAFENGLSVNEYSKTGKAANEINELIKEVVKV